MEVVGWARSLAVQALAREGVAGEHADYLLTLVYNALMSSVVLADGSRIPGIAMADDVAPELEFLYPCPEKGLPGLLNLTGRRLRSGAVL